jgi:hypothetical protein
MKTMSVLKLIKGIPKDADRTVCRVIDASLMALPLLFISVGATLESVYSGYSRFVDTISDLVWGPYGWLQTLLFVFTGLILMVMGWRLAMLKAGNKNIKTVVALMAVMGLAFMVIAGCPTNAPGTDGTWISGIHKLTAEALAVLFPLTCLACLPVFKAINGKHLLYGLTLFAAVTGFALDFVGLAAVVGSADWLGAIERVVMANGLLWLGITGFELWMTEDRASGPEKAYAWYGPTARQATCCSRQHREEYLKEVKR